jgi:hypothetical protein
MIFYNFCHKIYFLKSLTKLQLAKWFWKLETKYVMHQNVIYNQYIKDTFSIISSE